MCEEMPYQSPERQTGRSQNSTTKEVMSEVPIGFVSGELSPVRKIVKLPTHQGMTHMILNIDYCTYSMSLNLMHIDTSTIVHTIGQIRLRAQPGGVCVEFSPLQDDIHDLEKLFSPSMWNKRFNHTDVITNFMRLAEKALIRARENTSCEIDVPYGPSERTKYDVYGTDLPDDAPIFVFLHGGYWQELHKDSYAFPVESCVSEGIKVICVGYDLCPEGHGRSLWHCVVSKVLCKEVPKQRVSIMSYSIQLRDIVCQVKTVTHKILHDAAVSGSRGVWIGGHSAGAHLSASLLDPEWLKNEPNSSLIKGLVLLSGLYYLERVLNTSYNDLLKLDSNEARLMSTLNVKLPTPVKNLKALVVVAECDSPEFIEQGRRLVKELCSSVDNVEYILLRDCIDHFDIIENLVDKEFPLTQRIINLINCSPT